MLCVFAVELVIYTVAFEIAVVRRGDLEDQGHIMQRVLWKTEWSTRFCGPPSFLVSGTHGSSTQRLVGSRRSLHVPHSIHMLIIARTPCTIRLLQVARCRNCSHCDPANVQACHFARCSVVNNFTPAAYLLCYKCFIDIATVTYEVNRARNYLSLSDFWLPCSTHQCFDRDSR